MSLRSRPAGWRPRQRVVAPNLIADQSTRGRADPTRPRQHVRDSPDALLPDERERDRGRLERPHERDDGTLRGAEHQPREGEERLGRPRTSDANAIADAITAGANGPVARAAF